MSTKFTFKGIEFSVPTEELGEALRQLKILGSSLETEPRRQASLLPGEGLRLTPPPKHVLYAPRLSSDTSDGPVDASVVLQFLQIIVDHQTSGGAPIEAVMRALGANHPKGVGSKTAKVNEFLIRLGFEVDSVYMNPRDNLGMRAWKAGPKIDEAIKRLKSEVTKA